MVIRNSPQSAKTSDRGYRALVSWGLAFATLAIYFGIAVAEIKQGTFLAKGKKVSIVQDKGQLVIISTTSKSLSYKVSLAQAYRGGDLKRSNVEVDKKAGRITINAGTGNRASAVVFIPAATSLSIQFGEGSLKIGEFPGPMEASVANGTLEFDSVNLPSGKCIHAKAENGSVETPWGDAAGMNAKVTPCANAHVDLRVGNGSIEVK